MDKNDFLKLGHKIKYERSKRKLSQLELSLRTGITVRSISIIECGDGDPKFSTLTKIAEAMNMELKDLFDFKL